MPLIGSRAEVFHGQADKTSGGLTKKDLKISKSSDEVVSKLKAKQGKSNDWAVATKKARARLIRGVDGIKIGKDEMVLFNVGEKGKKLYEITKSIAEGMK